MEIIMQTITANEAKTRFGELIDRVHREPVRVTRRNRVVGVMLSAEAYAAMRAFYADRLARPLGETAREAAKKVLTRAELAGLFSARKTAVKGKRVSVGVIPGGGGILKKKKKN